MRGQPLDHINKLVDGRIIPARAGPTRDFSATECPGTDHPRSCGANAVCDIGCKLCCGSSPLVRGQLNVFLGFFHQLRIIPARAGPTEFDDTDEIVCPDHPRSCGANDTAENIAFAQDGSSPLVRGQRLGADDGHAGLRIIPARAGPTLRMKSESRTSPDHPRSCGANRATMSTSPRCSGSSPLVRGQLGSVTDRLIQARIIPARAGPTHRRRTSPVVSTDHPRSCGANLIANIRSVYGDGSSPLVRGQPTLSDYSLRCLRIIPARAGPTQWLGRQHQGPADHPRSCGANHIASVGQWFQRGSSPLVRGQQSDFTRKKRVESNKNI